MENMCVIFVQKFKEKFSSKSIVGEEESKCLSIGLIKLAPSFKHETTISFLQTINLTLSRVRKTFMAVSSLT